MNKIFLSVITYFTLFQCANALDYDFSSVKKIPIRMSVTEEISTKNPLSEGQKINLKVNEYAFYKNSPIVKKGDSVTAEISTVISAGMNGFPAEIIIENFEIPGLSGDNLVDTYVKKGQNRCFFVFPLKWALTPIPFAGSLTNFIKGGHAKIEPGDVVTIYYYPEWK